MTGGVSGRVSIREATFPTRDGAERPVRIYSPIHARGPLPIVLFFHGGGYVLGNTRMYDPLCSFLAKSIPAVVVSVDYRQAPEFRAPTALHDSVDGLRWAHANAESFRGDPARIAVCGDSAGGGLAALVCHAAYDEGGPVIAHQALLYPCTDATQSFPSAAEHGAAPVLSAEKIRVFTEHYLADVVDPTDPIVSAYWRKDLRGMPPALVQTADLDPLRDEGLAYAERLSDAGAVSYTHLNPPVGRATMGRCLVPPPVWVAFHGPVCRCARRSSLWPWSASAGPRSSTLTRSRSATPDLSLIHI